MALRKTISLTNNFGLQSVIDDAYIKVDRVYGGKEELCADVGIYDKAGGSQLTVVRHAFKPDLSGDNFISQSYDHLKALPEFAGAVDC